jgi:hypothetical protein
MAKQKIDQRIEEELGPCVICAYSARLGRAFRPHLTARSGSPGRRSERRDEYPPVGAKRRMDDQLFSVCSVVPSFFSFIPFLLRIDGPFSDRT